MEFEHKPVLFDECIQNLNIKPDGIYIDGTLGGAGHSSAIYQALNENGMLIGLDQDEFALEISKKRLNSQNGKGKLKFANTNFVNIKSVCEDNEIHAVDGILLDLGVSSHQLDKGERGFSYNKDAPLDMRMDRRKNFTAQNIVNEYSSDEIRRIIKEYGEERWAARIADFIVNRRNDRRIETTGELVEIIKAAIPSSARREGPHPAKRTFQALRIAVNDELGILAKTIEDGMRLLKSQGRFCIITFHSLEDRIVKNEFNRYINPCTCPSSFPVCVCGGKKLAQAVHRKPIAPSAQELEINPRSRSAKLRVVERV